MPGELAGARLPGPLEREGPAGLAPHREGAQARGPQVIVERADRMKERVFTGRTGKYVKLGILRYVKATVS